MIKMHLNGLPTKGEEILAKEIGKYCVCLQELCKSDAVVNYV